MNGLVSLHDHHARDFERTVTVVPVRDSLQARNPTDNLLASTWFDTLSSMGEVTGAKLQEWSDYLEWKRKLIDAGVAGARYVSRSLEADGTWMFAVALGNSPKRRSIEKALRQRGVCAEWGLYSRYKVTFDFLASYDTDEQTLVLRWFKRSWPDDVAAIQPGTRIVADDSVRTNMRFLPDYPRSELTTLARRFAAKSASGKKLPWTTGQRAVLFEIRSYPLPQEWTIA